MLTGLALYAVCLSVLIAFLFHERSASDQNKARTSDFYSLGLVTLDLSFFISATPHIDRQTNWFWDTSAGIHVGLFVLYGLIGTKRRFVRSAVLIGMSVGTCVSVVLLQSRHPSVSPLAPILSCVIASYIGALAMGVLLRLIGFRLVLATENIADEKPTITTWQLPILFIVVLTILGAGFLRACMATRYGTLFEVELVFTVNAGLYVCVFGAGIILSQFAKQGLSRSVFWVTTISLLVGSLLLGGSGAANPKFAPWEPNVTNPGELASMLVVATLIVSLVLASLTYPSTGIMRVSPKISPFKLTLRRLMVAIAVICCFLGWTKHKIVDQVDGAVFANFSSAPRADWREINGVRRITSLEFRWCSLKDMEALSQLAHLERLTVKNVASTDTQLVLQSISELDQLTWLSLEGFGIGNAEIAPIKQLENLQYLDISKTGISDQGLAPLSTMRNLKQLILPALDGSGLVNLNGMTSLESVDLSKSRKISADELANLPAQLQHLQFPKFNAGPYFNDSWKSENLKMLSFINHDFSTADWRRINGLKNLDTLELNACSWTKNEFEMLTSNSRLTMLNFKAIPLSDDQLEQLALMPQLRRLMIWYHGKPNLDLDSAGFRALVNKTKQLTFSFTLQVKDAATNNGYSLHITGSADGSAVILGMPLQLSDFCKILELNDSIQLRAPLMADGVTLVDPDMIVSFSKRHGVFPTVHQVNVRKIQHLKKLASLIKQLSLAQPALNPEDWKQLEGFSNLQALSIIDVDRQFVGPSFIKVLDSLKAVPNLKTVELQADYSSDETPLSPLEFSNVLGWQIEIPEKSTGRRKAIRIRE